MSARGSEVAEEEGDGKEVEGLVVVVKGSRVERRGDAPGSMSGGRRMCMVRGDELLLPVWRVEE